MKKIMTWILSVVLILVIAVFVAGNYMVNFALLPEPHGNDIEAHKAKVESFYPGILEWYDSLKVEGVLRDTVITNRDGFKLHGIYIHAADPAAATGSAITIHGYTDNHYGFLYLARMYREDLGFNVLMPDLFYHGYSEGTNVQMGWFDRLDVKQWLSVVDSLWPGKGIVVHGVSMGGATTMMLSGEPDLPENVLAFVDDCGYSTVWNQFSHNLKDMFGLPEFPVLYAANIVCKLRYGWSFKEASCLKQLAKCDRPMLFIHGDKDDFVPFADVYLNYDAKVNGYKELWVAEDTGHARAYSNHPEEYTEKVRNFLSNVF